MNFIHGNDKDWANFFTNCKWKWEYNPEMFKDKKLVLRPRFILHFKTPVFVFTPNINIDEITNTYGPIIHERDDEDGYCIEEGDCMFEGNKIYTVKLYPQPLILTDYENNILMGRFKTYDYAILFKCKKCNNFSFSCIHQGWICRICEENVGKNIYDDSMDWVNQNMDGNFEFSFVKDKNKLIWHICNMFHSRMRTIHDLYGIEIKDHYIDRLVKDK